MNNEFKFVEQRSIYQLHIDHSHNLEERCKLINGTHVRISNGELWLSREESNKLIWSNDPNSIIISNQLEDDLNIHFNEDLSLMINSHLIMSDKSRREIVLLRSNLGYEKRSSVRFENGMYKKISYPMRNNKYLLSIVITIFLIYFLSQH